MEAWMYDGYQRRGRIPDLGGRAILRRNDTSQFTLNIDGNDPAWRRWRTGFRTVITDETRQVLAGAATEIEETSRGGARDITLTGLSDMRWLGDMITLPSPARPADDQGIDAYYRDSGPAETVIRTLINRHIGPAARPEYQRTLTLDPDAGRGAPVTVNSRFKNLLEEVRALAGSELTVDIVQDTGSSRLVVRAGRDLSRAVRLSEDNGAVSEWTLKQSAPSLTGVLVAGQGEGAARTLRLMEGNANDWGVRALSFQDRRDTDDIAELEQAGRDTLAEAQETASVSCQVTDTPGLRFGRDYTLGDTVTVQLATGVTITDIVQSADITWGSTGRTVTLQVGPVDDDLDEPAWVAEVRRLRAQIRALEAR